MKRLLFLGYNYQQTRLIQLISKQGWRVFQTSEKCSALKHFDAVVSFGYKHILRPALLNTLTRPVINLHIAYLPFNRGADPNFWSFYDGTPAGVTIHHIDHGIDTGPICFQKQVQFKENELTFQQTYQRLIVEIEALFEQNIETLLAGDYTAVSQKETGTFHRAKDLPMKTRDWNTCIKDTIDALKYSRND